VWSSPQCAPLSTEEHRLCQLIAKIRVCQTSPGQPAVPASRRNHLTCAVLPRKSLGQTGISARPGPGQYARSMPRAAEQEPGSAQDWQAPAATGPVRARLRPPGSKSVTNRALVLAALAGSPTVITNPLRARDTRLMARALRALGARIDDGENGGGPDGGTGWDGGATGGGDTGDRGDVPAWRVTPGRPAGPATVDV